MCRGLVRGFFHLFPWNINESQGLMVKVYTTAISSKIISNSPNPTSLTI